MVAAVRGPHPTPKRKANDAHDIERAVANITANGGIEIHGEAKGKVMNQVFCIWKLGLLWMKFKEVDEMKIIKLGVCRV